jgi:hypothetical protein
MSELRSFVDQLRSEVLEDLPDAGLEEDFSELHLALEGLEAERLRRLAELDRRGVGRRLGHLSTAAWLASRFRMAWGAARGLVRMARGLDRMPKTRRALEEGEISMSAARILAHAQETDPRAFSESEEQLVEAARVHTVGDLHKVAAYWRQAAEREAALDGDERLRERRRLHASVTFLGMVRLDGDLDPETGETLLTALRAVMDAEARSPSEGDGRTPAQRRAERPGRGLPAVAGPRRPPRCGRREAPRHGHGRLGEPPRRKRPDQRDGSGGPRGPEHRPAHHLRCRHSPGGAGGTVRAARRGSEDPGSAASDAAGRRGPRPPLPIPWLRPATELVQRPPRGALGGRGPYGPSEPGPPVPAPSPYGPRTKRIPTGAGGWSAHVQAAGRFGAGGPGAAVAALSRSRPPSAARSGGSARPRTPWGALG